MGLVLPVSAQTALANYRPVQLDHAPQTHIVASPALALQAAARFAESHGVTPLILGDAIEGEAAQMGSVMAGIAHSAQTWGHPVRGPAVLLSGGEGTVTLGSTPPGKGGRNTEFLLSLGLSLAGTSDIWAMAGDSDGIDGSDDAAGAIWGPDTMQKAAQMGISARDHLARHDSYSFFDGVGALIRTGPTLTNVNDIRAILLGR